MAIDPQRPQITSAELDGWPKEYTFDANGCCTAILCHAKNYAGEPVDYQKTFTWQEVSGVGWLPDEESGWVEV